MCTGLQAGNLLLNDRRRGHCGDGVRAVKLPSGAMVLFAVGEHDPPFLSQVATVKSAECFAMFSNGAADGLVGGALDGMEV